VGLPSLSVSEYHGKQKKRNKERMRVKGER